ncbi:MULTISPECIES: LysR substrate-binding domain-containing protein [Burkholderia]|uniref:LysR family transcriptional regulator n=3 Tax=Burkholderia cepacia complex TaxID=87882 RepID=A0AAW3NUK4_9BURK|nr:MULTISPECIES: LysR substrate-binding domain-containing protein [Burkholderia]AOK20371.1 LysR family transcriptional regulator [Burkholderia cepacia]AOK27143.1 LysR family transcriptional regulator [Burkholderia ubonensis]KIP15017.1 bacterial regulatory helix-turn-helix, lysR family protein [Burkholderia sp. MSHR3999]KVA72919.1 LysR family transcriptional regulator [Burkholderia ubonensis]KVD08381.1 LysR family transcriptional regulator [Burkholderia ubonensis]
MRRLPNFVLLRAFEAAARLHSFALAAQELHLTPSAISHQVKELEQYFGRALFIRRNRRIEPTPEALRLVDTLGRVFSVIESACAEVSLAPASQVLAVHCAPSFAVKWLGPRLPAFAQLHPRITIRLSTGPEPLDLTRVQDVDVAISYGSAPNRPGIHTVSLGRERHVPMCAPRLLHEASDVRQLLDQATLIDTTLSAVTWRDWFNANDMPMPDRPRPSFDRAALAVAAAVDGMGLVLESVRFAERELARGDLVEIGGPSFVQFERETHFVSCRSSELHLPKLVAFRQWLLDEAGGEPDAPAR